MIVIMRVVVVMIMPMLMIVMMVVVIVRLKLGMVVMHVDFSTCQSIAKILHQGGPAIVVVDAFVNSRDEGINHV